MADNPKLVDKSQASWVAPQARHNGCSVSEVLTPEVLRSRLSSISQRSIAAVVASQFGPVVNASVINVLCSSSCALAEPVAGLALAERFTERTGIPSM